MSLYYISNSEVEIHGLYLTMLVFILEFFLMLVSKDMTVICYWFYYLTT